MTEKRIRVKLVGHDAHTAYIDLRKRPEPSAIRMVSKTVSLDDVINGYVGPRVHLDFNDIGELIGIEILA